MVETVKKESNAVLLLIINIKPNTVCSSCCTENEAQQWEQVSV